MKTAFHGRQLYQRAKARNTVCFINPTEYSKVCEFLELFEDNLG